MEPQQLLFELRDLAGDATAMTSMERLPKGEVVSVRFLPHQSLSVRLANYDFVLVSGAPFLLVDEKGSDVKLKGRRIVIGRSSSCQVSLDRRLKSISRQHLIVELADDGTVHFTDISFLGTYLPSSVV